MNKFVFNVKRLKMNKFIKYILQLIISTSNATLEVPRYVPENNAQKIDFMLQGGGYSCTLFPNL